MLQKSGKSIPLLRHQEGDLEWIHKVHRGLLGNEPGLGKTRSAITAYDGGENLVIAPKLVIEGGTWRDEIEKWSRYPKSWTVVPYSMLNSRVTTQGPTRKGSKPTEGLRPEYDRHWDAIIVDEAHYIKGRKTSWTKTTQLLAARTPEVLLMTGTPMPNWAHELFTLLQALWPEETSPGKKFGSYWRWVYDWFDVTPSRHNPQARVIGMLKACRAECATLPPTRPCEHYQIFVRVNLGDHFRRMLRDECLDLPPFTRQEVETPMSPTQRKIYRDLRKNWFAQLGDGTEVLAWNNGALHVALDRVTTSEWCLNPVGPAKGGKFEMLRFDLENRSRPTLVFAHYRTTVEGCASVAQQLGAKVGMIHGGVASATRSQVIEDFKAGRLDVLVGSLETLAEGLTLTVADMAIFVEASYKPSRNEQATYRIHRMGQTRPVTIRDYVTPATVDAKKRVLLATKTDHQIRVLSAADFSKLLI